jgi:hypothetical protein
MSGSTIVKKRRFLGVVAACTAAVVALSGCAGGSSGPVADTGSADSGSIDWWGWTPDDAPAQISLGASWIAGHGGIGERDYAPGYSRLLAGEVEFADGSAELESLAEFALALHRCISPDASVEVSA